MFCYYANHCIVFFYQFYSRENCIKLMLLIKHLALNFLKSLLLNDRDLNICIYVCSPSQIIRFWDTNDRFLDYKKLYCTKLWYKMIYITLPSVIQLCTNRVFISVFNRHIMYSQFYSYFHDFKRKLKKSGTLVIYNKKPS